MSAVRRFLLASRRSMRARFYHIATARPPRGAPASGLSIALRHAGASRRRGRPGRNEGGRRTRVRPECVRHARAARPATRGPGAWPQRRYSRFTTEGGGWMSTTATDTRALDELCVNTIRTLSMDAVQKANSGHPGAPMGLAPLAYLLYTRVMKHNPSDPDWPDRDRFVLSAGHASMLLYSMLYLTGYPLTLEDIKNFRQVGSPTAGHPERKYTPGIEITTGPLGQGLANSVGIALAECML